MMYALDVCLMDAINVFFQGLFLVTNYPLTMLGMRIQVMPHQVILKLTK